MLYQNNRMHWYFDFLMTFFQRADFGEVVTQYSNEVRPLATAAVFSRFGERPIAGLRRISLCCLVNTCFVCVPAAFWQPVLNTRTLSAIRILAIEMSNIVWATSIRLSRVNLGLLTHLTILCASISNRLPCDGLIHLLAQFWFAFCRYLWRFFCTSILNRLPWDGADADVSCVQPICGQDVRPNILLTKPIRRNISDAEDARR